MAAVSLARRPDRVDRPRVEGRVQLSSRAALALGAVLAAAFLLRVGVAVLSPNAEVSDETFATREAAHRLAYGYGLINPDWREGIRSWVFPAFLAGVMRATGSLGAGSDGYIVGIIVVLSLISLTAVWFSFVWAYRTSGVVAAFVAAGASACWYELVYYAPKAMYEVVAAHVLLPGLYLGTFGESIPERRRLFFAGLFFGLALALRPSLTPAVLLAAIVCGLRDSRARFPALAAGMLVPVAAFGIVDALTWPYPFYSFVRFFSVNIVHPIPLDPAWAAEHQWTRPWYWFVPVLALRLGPMAVFALAGLRRSPLLGWVALAILLTHSAVGHKEFRFIYPIIPLAVTLAGIGVAVVLPSLGDRWRWLRSPVTAGASGLVLCLGVSAVLAQFFPLWSRYSGNLLAFQALSRDPTACGVALVGPQVDPVISGGYTYLHKDIPIYFFRTPNDAARLAPSFNAVVTALPGTYAGFELVRCWSGTCLYRSRGSCVPSPGNRVKFLPVG